MKRGVEAAARVAAPIDPARLAELGSAADEAAALLKSLANPDRLLLLCNLVEGECHVSGLEERTGIGQPTLSQQLGILRDDGLVETRRDGRFVHYRIASEPALAVLKTLYDTFCPPARNARSPSPRPSAAARSMPAPPISSAPPTETRSARPRAATARPSRRGAAR